MKFFIRQFIASSLVFLLSATCLLGAPGKGSGSARSSARSSVNQNTNVNRNTNVNVNRNRDIDVDVDVHHQGGYYGGGCCYHSGVGVAAAIATTAVVTAAIVGSRVNTLPPSCTVMIVNGITYQQCGGSWYQPQFVGGNTTYVVVIAPR